MYIPGESSGTHLDLHTTGKCRTLVSYLGRDLLRLVVMQFCENQMLTLYAPGDITCSCFSEYLEVVNITLNR